MLISMARKESWEKNSQFRPQDVSILCIGCKVTVWGYSTWEDLNWGRFKMLCKIFVGIPKTSNYIIW